MSIQPLTTARKALLTEINNGASDERTELLINHVVDIEREIARTPMTSSNDALAAAHVLAELVIAGPASDGRDVAIAP